MENSSTHEHLTKQLDGLAHAICQAHEEAKMEHGHNADHALRVGSLAAVIALDEWGDSQIATLAMAAGYCHNADRILAKLSGVWRKDMPPAEVEPLVQQWLKSTDFEESEKERIVSAVLKHEEPNKDDDEPVLIALKDADRVVVSSLDVVIRAGQIQPHLPVIDPQLLVWEDKRGRFNHRWTVAADLADCFQWEVGGENSVRTKLGVEMIRDRLKELRHFLDTMVRQREEEELIPYPFQWVTTEEPSDAK